MRTRYDGSVPLDFNALNVFYHTARLGGVGAAARALSVTQPAVSKRLRDLEHRLGKKLYGRADNRFALTEDGRELFESCQTSFKSLESLNLTGRPRAPERLRGLIRIASLTEFTKVFLLDRLARFRALHPAVRWRISYHSPLDIVPMLVRHETDLAFVNDPCDKTQLESVPVFGDEYVLVGKPPKRRFSWEDLPGLPWLCCSSEEEYWFELCRMLSARKLDVPTPAIEVAEIETLLLLAARGLGQALVPLPAFRFRPNLGLVAHDIPFKRIWQPVRMARLRTVEPGSAAAAFWDFVRVKQR